MRQKYTPTLFILFAVLISLAFSANDEKGKVHLKVTKEENGSQQVFEKQYSSMEELKADQELKQFDVMVENWANESDNHFTFSSGDENIGEKTIIIKKKTGDGEMTWVSDEDEEKSDKEGHVEKNIIRIKTSDGEENFSMEIEDDGDSKMIWIDENGNKTELTDDMIEKMIAEKETESSPKIHKKIVIKTSDGKDENAEVIVMRDSDKKEIEVEVEKEIDKNGEEKIISKKVWVTKDGEKVELDEDADFQFESDGKKVIIEVDKESMESADFSGGTFEGDRVMVFKNKSDEEPRVKQSMNINIDEKNGEQFIEIDIKRNKKTSVTISDIQKDDASLREIDYGLKNNLKPTQLNYFPNPSNGRFTLNFQLDQKDAVTVSVMDILGKEVYKEKLPDFQGVYDNQIDLGGKDKGIYILQISQKKKTLTRKILIE